MSIDPKLKGHVRYLLEAELKRRQDDLARLEIEVRRGVQRAVEMLADYRANVEFSKWALRAFESIPSTL